MSDSIPATDPAYATDPAVEPLPAPANQISTDPVENMTCPQCGALVDVRGIEAFSRIQCPSCNAEIPVPARFGHFLLLRRLGSGGMGTAFLAEDETLGRKVAIKVMQKALCADEKAFATFKNEAQSAARLNHPHVAQVYSFGQEKGNPYLEMELVPCGDLGSYISDGEPLDPAFVLRVGLEIAEGLKAAEGVGLFHGDVKPDNILFDENASAKLVDFGIASRSSQGKSDELWGTPYYIAPEKVQKKMNSARSDIYSLGATLYHAITGQPPYEGADAVEVIKARFKGPPPPVESLRPDVEPEVSRIISRMMYNDLFMRYPNYNSLIGDLKKYLEGVSPIRKQGPKGAARRAAGLTGTVRPEGQAAAEGAGPRTGKKRFVVTKGQMEAAEARKEMEAASGRRAAESGASGGKLRIRTRGSVAPAASPGADAEAAGAQGADEEQAVAAADESGKGGGGRGVLFAILGFIGFLLLSVVVLAIWYFGVKLPNEKNLTRMAYEECKTQETRFNQLRQEIAELGAKATALDARLDPMVADVDRMVYEALDVHYVLPDIEPAVEVAAAEPEVGATVTADQALAAADPNAAPAEAAPAPKPAPRRRESALDAYIRIRLEKAGYGTAEDFRVMIAGEAKQAEYESVEEYAKAQLAELGVEFDAGPEPQPEAPPEEAPAAAADAPVAADPAAPVGGIPADLADILDKEFVSRARIVRAAVRFCEGQARRIESADSPLRPLGKAPSLKEYQEVGASRKTACDELESVRAQMEARISEIQKALKEMDLLLKPPKQGKVKTTVYTVTRRHLEARRAAEAAAAAEAARVAEEAARAEAEQAAAAVAAEEILRVQDTAQRHQPLIDAFDYETFIARMRRMESGELTTEAGRLELATAVARAQCCIDLRKWILSDLERGEVRHGFLNRYDIRGISRDHTKLQIRNKPDFPVADLKLNHWIWLCHHLLENRPPERRGISDMERGDQMINAAVFFYLHGKGEYMPLERSRKLARAALELRGARRAEVCRLLPFMADDDPSADEGGAED